MMTGPAITTDHLTKTYDGTDAVQDLSISVEKGEIFGLLGPNGAGKTTTTSMLTTLVTPSSGTATVNGHDIEDQPDRVRQSIGIVFQESALDDWLTGRENLRFHARMYGLSKQKRQDKIETMLDLVDLTDDADRPVEDYSGGMKRRLEIARGLLQEPDVLFLDEPTLGLDAGTRRSIWQYIETLNSDHEMTIILTTHYMEEADRLCDRVGIMQDGTLEAIDTPTNLKAQFSGDILDIDLDDDPDDLVADLETEDWIETIDTDGQDLTLTIQDSEHHLADLIDLIESHDLTITRINLREPSLEDVYIHLTDSELDDDAWRDPR